MSFITWNLYFNLKIKRQFTISRKGSEVKGKLNLLDEVRIPEAIHFKFVKRYKIQLCLLYQVSGNIIVSLFEELKPQAEFNHSSIINSEFILSKTFMKSNYVCYAHSLLLLYYLFLQFFNGFSVANLIDLRALKINIDYSYLEITTYLIQDIELMVT